MAKKRWQEDVPEVSSMDVTVVESPESGSTTLTAQEPLVPLHSYFAHKNVPHLNQAGMEVWAHARNKTRLTLTEWEDLFKDY